MQPEQPDARPGTYEGGGPPPDTTLAREGTSPTPPPVASHTETAVGGPAREEVHRPDAAEQHHPTAAPKDVGPASSLTRLVRALGMLALIGASVWLAGWTFRVPADDFVNYVRDNKLGRIGRLWVAANLAGGATVGVCVGLTCVVARRRRGFNAGLVLAETLSQRLSPLTLSAFLPFLFDHRHWQDRDLAFLALATAFALTLLGLARWSLTARPVLPLELRRRLAFRLRPFYDLVSRPATPLILVVGSALAYTVYFSYFTISNHYNLGTASFDLGIENNLMWNLVHGGPLFKTTPHEAGPEGSHLGFHQTYLSFVLAPVYALAPRPETLLIIQAFLIGAAAIPLFLLAKNRISPWSAVVMALGYLLYAPVHGANLYDFHYPPFMPFFMWFLLYFVERGSTWRTLLFVLLSMSIREDAAGCVGLLGAYMVLTGLRPRMGLLVMGMGLSHFVTVKMIVMPWVLEGHSAYVHQYRELIPKGVRGFGGVLLTVLGNPGYLVQTLVAEPHKLVYVLQIMTPLVFLPWRRPIGILLSLPGFFFTLLATHYDPMIQISFQYTFFWTTFLFVAAILNLEWIRRPRHPEDTGGAVREKAWVIAIAASMLVTSYQYGGILQTETVVGGFGHVRFGPNASARERLADLRQLIALIPPDGKVVSSETIVPHVSSRENAYTLRVGLFDADYILFEMPIRSDERDAVRKALEEGTHGIVQTRGAFGLARKGHDTTRNLETTQRL